MNLKFVEFYKDTTADMEIIKSALFLIAMIPIFYLFIFAISPLQNMMNTLWDTMPESARDSVFYSSGLEDMVTATGFEWWYMIMVFIVAVSFMYLIFTVIRKQRYSREEQGPDEFDFR